MRRVIILEDICIHIDIVPTPTHQYNLRQESPINHVKGCHIVYLIPDIDTILIPFTIDQVKLITFV